MHKFCSVLNSPNKEIYIVCYTIIKSIRVLWLVNQLCFIVRVTPWKFRVSSELLYKSNRPQVFMVYRLINHLWCWKNTRRNRKSLACGSWFTNSSSVLPTSRMVYQPINHRNLWSIAQLVHTFTRSFVRLFFGTFFYVRLRSRLHARMHLFGH